MKTSYEKQIMNSVDSLFKSIAYNILVLQHTNISIMIYNDKYNYVMGTVVLEDDI